MVLVRSSLAAWRLGVQTGPLESLHCLTRLAPSKTLWYAQTYNFISRQSLQSIGLDQPAGSKCNASLSAALE
jgi:hypothetical protein